jgi:hypothetical protein
MLGSTAASRTVVRFFFDNKDFSIALLFKDVVNVRLFNASLSDGLYPTNSLSKEFKDAEKELEQVKSSKVKWTARVFTVIYTY